MRLKASITQEDFTYIDLDIPLEDIVAINRVGRDRFSGYGDCYKVQFTYYNGHVGYEYYVPVEYFSKCMFGVDDEEV